MPIYIYKGNSQISTNAVRNDKAVKAIYAKEQGKDAVCVWGVGLNTWVLTYTKNATSVIITGLKEGVALEALIIPETIDNLPVTQIASNAFKDNTNLKSIELPNSLQSIGSQSFSGCTGLMRISGSATNASTVAEQANPSSFTVNITSGTSIDYYAFQNCTGLTSVTIGNSVTSIRYHAFDGCTGLTSVTIGNNVTSISSNAFKNCNSLTSITIPDSVTIIDNSAFYNCTGLTSVTIGNSVTSIEAYAFQNCTGLTSITIPNGMTRIGEQTFWGCTGLASVEIPDSVTSVGVRAFHNTAWYNNQPNGLVYVGKVAYTYKGTMPHNTSIVLKEGTLGIGDYAFQNCDGLKSITIPDSVTNIGSNSFHYCGSLTNITVADGNTKYHSDGNCIIETESKILVLGCNISVIPSDGSVTSIGEHAFDSCYRLPSITIPDSVTSIGNYAFDGCSKLTSITIPDSVTSIGYTAFAGCTGLTSVTIGNSVTSIGVYAFRECTGLTSITIPDSITRIEGYVFSECTGLTSITIPDSVTRIDEFVFNDCSGLTSITFTGTKAQWNAITKDSRWNSNTGNYTIHCTDGDIPK